MKIRFIGDKEDISFTVGKIYDAVLLPENKYGKDQFSIFDDTGDSYVYSKNYIQENFEVFES